MFKRAIGSVLIATVLLQGWVASSVAMPVDSAPMEHCGGAATDSDDHGCCPDSGMSSSHCQTHCSLSVAITIEFTAAAATRHVPPERLLPPGRASPAYLPPNPPPNA
jgi:hypothetical protein